MHKIKYKYALALWVLMAALFSYFSPSIEKERLLDASVRLTQFKLKIIKINLHISALHANLNELQIRTSPPESIIRILNIRPKYKPGMTLKPGKYHIEISHPDYETKTFWVDMPLEETPVKVTLNAKRLPLDSRKRSK